MKTLKILKEYIRYEEEITKVERNIFEKKIEEDENFRKQVLSVFENREAFLKYMCDDRLYIKLCAYKYFIEKLENNEEIKREIFNLLEGIRKKWNFQELTDKVLKDEENKEIIQQVEKRVKKLYINQYIEKAGKEILGKGDNKKVIDNIQDTSVFSIIRDTKNEKLRNDECNYTSIFRVKYKSYDLEKGLRIVVPCVEDIKGFYLKDIYEREFFYDWKKQERIVNLISFPDLPDFNKYNYLDYHKFYNQVVMKLQSDIIHYHNSFPYLSQDNFSKEKLKEIFELEEEKSKNNAILCEIKGVKLAFRKRLISDKQYLEKLRNYLLDKNLNKILFNISPFFFAGQNVYVGLQKIFYNKIEDKVKINISKDEKNWVSFFSAFFGIDREEAKSIVKHLQRTDKKISFFVKVGRILLIRSFLYNFIYEGYKENKDFFYEPFASVKSNKVEFLFSKIFKFDKSLNTQGNLDLIQWYIHSQNFRFLLKLEGYLLNNNRIFTLDDYDLMSPFTFANPYFYVGEKLGEMNIEMLKKYVDTDLFYVRKIKIHKFSKLAFEKCRYIPYTLPNFENPYIYKKRIILNEKILYDKIKILNIASGLPYEFELKKDLIYKPPYKIKIPDFQFFKKVLLYLKKYGFIANFFGGHPYFYHSLLQDILKKYYYISRYSKKLIDKQKIYSIFQIPVIRYVLYFLLIDALNYLLSYIFKISEKSIFYRDWRLLYKLVYDKVIEPLRKELKRNYNYSLNIKSIKKLGELTDFLIDYFYLRGFYEVNIEKIKFDVKSIKIPDKYDYYILQERIREKIFMDYGIIISSIKELYMQPFYAYFEHFSNKSIYNLFYIENLAFNISFLAMYFLYQTMNKHFAGLSYVSVKKKIEEWEKYVKDRTFRMHSEISQEEREEIKKASQTVYIDYQAKFVEGKDVLMERLQNFAQQLKYKMENVIVFSFAFLPFYLILSLYAEYSSLFWEDLREEYKKEFLKAKEIKNLMTIFELKRMKLLNFMTDMIEKKIRFRYDYIFSSEMKIENNKIIRYIYPHRLDMKDLNVLYIRSNILTYNLGLIYGYRVIQNKFIENLSKTFLKKFKEHIINASRFALTKIKNIELGQECPSDSDIFYYGTMWLEEVYARKKMDYIITNLIQNYSFILCKRLKINKIYDFSYDFEEEIIENLFSN